MTKDEALKLALEAMTYAQGGTHENKTYHHTYQWQHQRHQAAVARRTWGRVQLRSGG